MTDEHKAALAEGRAQGRAVRAYLEALETNKPKRGRKRSPASMRTRIEAIDACDRLTEVGQAEPDAETAPAALRTKARGRRALSRNRGDAP